MRVASPVFPGIRIFLENLRKPREPRSCHMRRRILPAAFSQCCGSKCGVSCSSHGDAFIPAPRSQLETRIIRIRGGSCSPSVVLVLVERSFLPVLDGQILHWTEQVGKSGSFFFVILPGFRTAFYLAFFQFPPPPPRSSFTKLAKACFFQGNLQKVAVLWVFPRSYRKAAANSAKEPMEVLNTEAHLRVLEAHETGREGEPEPSAAATRVVSGEGRAGGGQSSQHLRARRRGKRKRSTRRNRFRATGPFGIRFFSFGMPPLAANLRNLVEWCIFAQRLLFGVGFASCAAIFFRWWRFFQFA